jgi:hypothetical protein
MVAVHTQLIDRRAALAGLALAALAPLGCLGKNAPKTTFTPPPPQGKLVSIWGKKIQYADDPFHGGELVAGLAGRIYLIGPGEAGIPFIGDGSMLIDLWDSTPHGAGSKPKMTDHYIFPPEMLIQFAKKDIWGDGYSIFIPWANYRPDITQIYVNVLYTSAAGEKYFGGSGTFSLDHAETAERARKGEALPTPMPGPGPAPGIREAAARQ